MLLPAQFQDPWNIITTRNWNDVSYEDIEHWLDTEVFSLPYVPDFWQCLPILPKMSAARRATFWIQYAQYVARTTEKRAPGAAEMLFSLLAECIAEYPDVGWQIVRMHLSGYQALMDTVALPIADIVPASYEAWQVQLLFLSYANNMSLLRRQLNRARNEDPDILSTMIPACLIGTTMQDSPDEIRLWLQTYIALGRKDAPWLHRDWQKIASHLSDEYLLSAVNLAHLMPSHVVSTWSSLPLPLANYCDQFGLVPRIP